jgi:hypothetical protein
MGAMGVCQVKKGAAEAPSLALGAGEAMPDRRFPPPDPRNLRMRVAGAVLKELVRHVCPPRGCALVLTE